jgi:hypothetical protein
MTLSVTRDRARKTVVIRAVAGPAVFEIEEQPGHALAFWHELSKVVAAPDTEARAEAGYSRYVAHCGGVSVHGEPLPAWGLMNEAVRQHWIAAFTE